MMKTYLCLLSSALLGFHCSEGEIQVKIASEKEVMYVTHNNNVTITCEASELNGKALRWHHGGEQIASVLESMFMFSDKAYEKKYLLGREGGNFTFTILNFTLDDSGQISCEATGARPSNIQLEAFVPPESISLRVESAHRQVRWNGSMMATILDPDDGATLSCSVVNGRPKAEIVWMWGSLSLHRMFSNISVFAEEAMALHTVTSYITIPSGTFRSINTDASEKFNETNANTTSFVENITGGEDYNQTIVSKVQTSIRPTSDSGKISCVASVGDRSYITSRTILLHAEYNAAGFPCCKSDWKLTTSVTVLFYVVLASTMS